MTFDVLRWRMMSCYIVEDDVIEDYLSSDSIMFSFHFQLENYVLQI